MVTEYGDYGRMPIRIRIIPANQYYIGIGNTLEIEPWMGGESGRKCQGMMGAWILQLPPGPCVLLRSVSKERT